MRFQHYGLVVNTSKCVLGFVQIEFLGHLISSQAIWPFDSKVNIIREFLEPMALRIIREFLGFITFHQRFVPRWANLI